jgi:MYXO-CTERM domain-containing protein
VGTAALIGAPQAEAAVTAVTFGFGTEFNAADGSNLYWTVGPGFGTLGGSASTGNLRLGLHPGTGLGSVYHNAAYGFSTGLARFFANNTIIGAAGNGARGYAYFQADYNPLVDFTSDQLNQNIGFRTSTNNWGWANVSWTEATKTLAINSAYVESVANTNITVGDVGAVPEPSRALLALAGLGGVALRRRRKQVA